MSRKEFTKQKKWSTTNTRHATGTTKDREDKVSTLQNMEKTYDEKVQNHQITKTKKIRAFVVETTAQDAERHPTAK